MVRTSVLPNLSKYRISSCGRIIKSATGRYMKPTLTKDYLRIRLVGDDGSRKCYSVHVLVLSAFSEKPESSKVEINHIDGNKENNCLENLEWVSHSDNMKHAYRSGLQVPILGGIHGQAKLTEGLVVSIRHKYETGSYTQRELALMFGVNKATISRVISRKIWKHV